MSDINSPEKGHLQGAKVKQEVYEFTVHGEMVSKYVSIDNEHFKNLRELLDLPEKGTLEYRLTKRFVSLFIN